ncbi:MAG: hypothetical protein PHW62_00330 [Candidatus Ratteibacteria bacterium]|nr:hypothetical protein [Candidatus Ratteibacteria bacterium]
MEEKESMIIILLVVALLLISLDAPVEPKNINETHPASQTRPPVEYFNSRLIVNNTSLEYNGTALETPEMQRP